jgi:hypothetical protein
LLRRAADPSLDPRYVDQLNIALLPFLHPKPRSDLTAKPLFMMSDQELQQCREAEVEHARQVARGRPLLRVVKPK